MHDADKQRPIEHEGKLIPPLFSPFSSLRANI